MRRPFQCSYGCHGQEAHARSAAFFARRQTVRFPGSKEYDFTLCTFSPHGQHSAKPGTGRKDQKNGAFAVKTPSLFSNTSNKKSDLSLDLVVDTLSVKLEFLHEGACRTALAESVIDADLCNLDRILFSENIANCAAHAADN